MSQARCGGCVPVHCKPSRDPYLGASVRVRPGPYAGLMASDTREQLLELLGDDLLLRRGVYQAQVGSFFEHDSCATCTCLCLAIRMQ